MSQDNKFCLEMQRNSKWKYKTLAKYLMCLLQINYLLFLWSGGLVPAYATGNCLVIYSERCLYYYRLFHKTTLRMQAALASRL